jgi:hypothetical protein
MPNYIFCQKSDFCTMSGMINNCLLVSYLRFFIFDLKFFFYVRYTNNSDREIDVVLFEKFENYFFILIYNEIRNILKSKKVMNLW